MPHSTTCRPSPDVARYATAAFAAQNSQSQMPLRVAQCLVGLADPGLAYERDARRGFKILDARQHDAIREWSDTLSSAHGIKSSWFLRLDLRRTIRSRRAGGSETNTRMSDEKFSPLDQPSCNASAASHPEAILTPVIAALRPVSVQTRPLPCFCAARASTCACGHLRKPASLGSRSAAGLVGWWEQMAKVRACFDDVVRYEVASGLRFDFVTKIRSDYDFWRRVR